MKLWSRISSWWKAPLQRTRMASEMDAELRFHVEAYADDLVRGGASPEEAMRRARIEFGGPDGVREKGASRLGAEFSVDLLMTQ